MCNRRDVGRACHVLPGEFRMCVHLLLLERVNSKKKTKDTEPDRSDLHPNNNSQIPAAPCKTHASRRMPSAERWEGPVHSVTQDPSWWGLCPRGTAPPQGFSAVCKGRHRLGQGKDPAGCIAMCSLPTVPRAGLGTQRALRK